MKNYRLHVLVHTGSDLYGSGAMLVRAIEALQERWPADNVRVILPAEGPLSEVLRKRNVELVIVPLCVIRRTALAASIFSLARLPWNVIKISRLIRGATSVTLNTIVALEYYFLGFLSRFKTSRYFIYVHEVPKLNLARVFEFLFRVGNLFPIYVSRSTASVYRFGAASTGRVIYNCSPDHSHIPRLSEADQPRLNILLVGRFNGIKGQEVAVRAVAALSDVAKEHVNLRLVGGYFGSASHFEQSIRSLVGELAVTNIVEILGHKADVAPEYQWADLVIVPSTIEESFGLVATEAMSFGKPVFASQIGALPEVVEDGQTGRLFPAGDHIALAALIEWASAHRDQLEQMGLKGRQRFLQRFSETRYRTEFTNLIVDQSSALRRNWWR